MRSTAELHAKTNQGITVSYGLLVTKDAFQVLVNGAVVKSGHFMNENEFTPIVFDYLEINDPDDKKPPQEEWDERETIEDPNAKKPEGWDDIKPQIPDPTAVKPDGTNEWECYEAIVVLMLLWQIGMMTWTESGRQRWWRTPSTPESGKPRWSLTPPTRASGPPRELPTRRTLTLPNHTSGFYLLYAHQSQTSNQESSQIP